jgi:hypothetical protein
MQFDASSLKPMQGIRDVPHLGVLLDAGRHYFPVEWIKRMINVLSIMNYNLLHFRLTDDQAFNILLESHPDLAYPSIVKNNTKVYAPKELKEIVKYAKNKGIEVIPEINVPGHAGAWGGIPDLIVQCPKFICEKGYGIPLNVSNPKLRPVLKDILTEVVDIFDRPSFLHLGGDEVDMAQPCFDEVKQPIFDYNEFEVMLGEIIREIGYNESQIIRWEMTGHQFDKPLSRSGTITHFWFSKPGTDQYWKKKYGENFTNPIFMSEGLYFDTNQDDSGWEVYVKTKRIKHLPHEKSPNLGIIAGTFELSTDYWFDRNVVGRLLAVSLGASTIHKTSAKDFFETYKAV